MTEQNPAPEEDDLPEQMQVRHEKRSRLLDEGRAAYPVSVPRTHSLAQVRAEWPNLEPDTTTGTTVSVSARVIFFRNTGKLCFATLRDGDGTELQAMFSLDKIGEESLADWKATVDIGDFVSVTGEVISSKRGELSVLADSWQLASKALRPLPVAHKPLGEETRVRQRYVDLIMRDEARRMARMRPQVMQSIRSSFAARNYTEVETPMLQVMHGGATARPFKTHSNAYDMDLFLRIAPELYLKRCVVGGIEKVFEINRNFRNEGADSSHSPEFVMIESYEAYGDWNSMAKLTKELVQQAAIDVFGSTKVKHADEKIVDLGGEWDEVELFPITSKAIGENITAETSMPKLQEIAKKLGIKIDPKWVAGKLVEEIFEHAALPKLTKPTFVKGYPIDTSPLVRQHRSQSGVAEKWDLYVQGFELATGYSELVDPVVQRERLVEQAKLGAKGDLEAMQLDEDFLRAMEHGMPPTGGMGMGLDRLLMALTGLGIRETILFPLVKPLAED